MNDAEIRVAFKSKVLTRYIRTPYALVIDELGLANGSSRIDIAVVTNRLLGYEIKSGQDTLRRLPRQVGYYNSVFSRMTLIVDYSHAYEASRMIPLWWGIRLAERKPNGDVFFQIAREAKENPSPDKFAMVKLLWRNEALNILKQIGADSGFRIKSREEIYKRLVESIEIDELRVTICNRLRLRVNWRADELRVKCAY